MTSSKTPHLSVLTDLRQHIVSIIASVIISLAVCRFSVMTVLVCLGICGAIIMWLTGWRLKVIAYHKNEPTNKE